MFLNKKVNIYKVTVYVSVIITLIATPNFNKDALIIPKVILLFLLALFMLPVILSLRKLFNQTIIYKYLLVIIVLILVQIALITIASNAPIEQQMFGRTGRGLGLLTLVSFFILLIGSALVANKSLINVLFFGLMLSGSLSSLYAVFQSFGLDFFPWDSRTNGVIGTLGNPNFISSFAAMTILPAFFYTKAKFNNVVFPLILTLLFVFTIYRAQSYQGYIAFIIALSIFFVIYFWFKSKIIFILAGSIFIFSSVLTAYGFFNKGPLAGLLYKSSVQSRGEFWGAAINASNDNPFFGVGLDSFGDYSLKYRSSAIINEYTDSAHNYLLDFSSNGGYPLATLYLMIILLTMYCFYRIQKQLSTFNSSIAVLFSTYLVFQAQSLISPINIPLMVWNLLISGTVIGLAANLSVNDKMEIHNQKIGLGSIASILIGLIFVFPYFNSDRLQLQAMNNSDGDLAIKVAKMYPESVVRYSVLTRALLASGLNSQALDLAYSAVKFNPNSPALLALILINPNAPIAERVEVKEKLLILDPLNNELKNFLIQ